MSQFFTARLGTSVWKEEAQDNEIFTASNNVKFTPKNKINGTEEQIFFCWEKQRKKCEKKYYYHLASPCVQKLQYNI